MICYFIKAKNKEALINFFSPEMVEEE